MRLCHKILLTGCFLIKAPVPTNVVSQITSRKVVHDQVEVLFVLKGVVHVHDEWVLKLCQDLPLIDNGLDTALRYDASLAHLFHGKVVFGLLALDSPHFAKATLTDAKVIHKVGL